MNLRVPITFFMILIVLHTSYVVPSATDKAIQQLSTMVKNGVPVTVRFDATTVDYDALGKGVAQGLSTALSNVGKAIPEGTQEWGENARQAGRHMGDAQRKFWQESAQGARESAPHLRAIQQHYVRSLLHPHDIASYAATVGMGMLISLSLYYVGKLLWTVIEKLIIKKISKPKILIRQKMGLWDRIKSWFNETKPTPMVLDETVKERLLKIVRVTKKTNIRLRKKNSSKISYRNILLWGPPGTGKTMFARYLAEESGMDFAETTGGAFFQEGAEIASIDDLFDWAERSRRGLIIFIDEADSLFVDRTLLRPGTEEHRIVNHFLNRLGQASNKFMLIAATNHKAVLDKAMARRIHESIYMPLPALQTRINLIKLNIDGLLQVEYEQENIYDHITELFSEQYIYNIAVQIDGFSHADIAAMFENLKTELQDIEDNNVMQKVKTVVHSIIEQYCVKKIELEAGGQGKVVML